MAPRKKKRHFREKPIPIRLDDALMARIDALAKKLGEPRSTVMRFAMRVGLENLSKAMDSGADLASLAQSTTYPPHREQASLVEDRDMRTKPKP